MAAELDPIFVRALYLLHSRHPKSLEELCALRDEALGKKPEAFEVKKENAKEMVKVEIPNKTTTELPRIKQEDVKIVKKEPAISATSVVDNKDVMTETVEVESSSLSSKAKDFNGEEMIETVEELSSSFSETLEELSSSNLLMSKKKKPRLLDISGANTIIEDLGKVSRESSPEHEISTDLGSQCVLCMSGKTNLPGNQLVACHECHEYYHQNCHKPNITDQNINDPRHVWYCSSCVKKMKEAASTAPTSKQKQMNASGLSFKHPNQSFKPPMKPPSFSPGSSSVNQSFSIPSFTANSTNTSSTSTSSGGLKSPNNAYPRDVARNSMKRLQMVKKKAAAKNQQRFAKR